MIRDAFELQSERTQPRRSRRNGRVRHALERLAVGPRERHGGITGHAGRETMRVLQLQRLEAPLDTLVYVAETLLESQHLFADDREAEVAGLDDARMHRPDRHFVHAVAFDAHEMVVVHGGRRFGDRRVALRRQRMKLRGPRGVTQPWSLVRSLSTAGHAGRRPLAADGPPTERRPRFPDSAPSLSIAGNSTASPPCCATYSA